jgi:hypothetical protein
VPFKVSLDDDEAVTTGLVAAKVEPDAGLILISIGGIGELFACRTSLPFLRCLSLIEEEDLELLRERIDLLL